MAYVKDTGTPGNNNAELPTGAVLDTTAKTLSLEVDTKLPSFVVLNDRQWLILETRNINGTANLIGECSYSEDSIKLADILTFVNDVRTRMMALHTTFDITVTHYKGGNTIDVYRGDEATAATLEVADTDVTFTPPTLWSIDDLTPFAPPVSEASTNIVIDSTCDSVGDWDFENTNITVTGGKIEFSAGGRAYPHLTEALIEGASYELAIDCDVLTEGYYRFYIGNSEYSDLVATLGTYTRQLTCPAGAIDISVQGASGFVGTMDNFTCERV